MTKCLTKCMTKSMDTLTQDDVKFLEFHVMNDLESVAIDSKSKCQITYSCWLEIEHTEKCIL
jgi:hypothetical protein